MDPTLCFFVSTDCLLAYLRISSFVGWAKLHLKDWVVMVTHHHKVKVASHLADLPLIPVCQISLHNKTYTQIYMEINLLIFKLGT